jgi:prolipoprotein diacylglyceryl transferase
LIASIPSPKTGEFHLGPLLVHAYGLLYGVAVVAAVLIARKRWVARGGSAELVDEVALWGFPAGLVGGRIYHVVTSWNEVPHTWWGPFAVWKGGLGIWGGIALGVIVGLWRVKRRGEDVPLFMDLAGVPALLVAQSIGRVGNWFNQELFGKPTDLPWGLRIDAEHQASLPAKYLNAPGYHPTFLYEFIYDIVGVIVLLLVDRRFRIRRPALFALYVSIYCFGRFFEELLRIDPAHMYLGLRLNAWVSIVLFVLSTAFFIWWQFIREPTGTERPRASRVVPKGPAMAVPKGRVRSGR